MFSSPIHYKGPAGTWLDINTTLTSLVGGRLGTSAVAWPTSFAANGADIALASTSIDATRSASFGLTGAQPVAGVQSGSAMTYAHILPGITLIAVAEDHGLNDTLTLDSPNTAHAFSFPLRLHGLTATQDPSSGDIVYSDATGAQMRTPRGIMHDSAVDERSHRAATSAGLTYTLATGADGNPVIRVSLDDAWLNDPTRVYPVIVDPQFGPQTTSDDTFVQNTYPGHDYSQDTELPAGTFNGGADKVRSFMYFDPSSMNGDTINSATLQLFDEWSYQCSPRSVTISRITQSWSGPTTVYYPGPNISDGFATAPFAFGHTGCTPAGDFVNIDVRTAVQNWASSIWPAYGLAITSNESDSYSWKEFRSSQATAGYRPNIVADYTVPVTNHNPIGAFDTATGGVGRVHVTGWALDQDAGTRSDGLGTNPIAVHIYVDNVLVEGFLANTYRHDVALANPGQGDYHGFDHYTTIASVGSHNVCIYAINVPTGANPQLGCKTATITAATTPSQPLNLTAAADTDGTVALSWSPPSSDGGADIDSYIVYPFNPTTNTWVSAKGSVSTTCTGGQSCTGATFTGLDMGTSYYFKVKAHNSVGYSFLSAASNTVTPTTWPSAPQNAQATSTGATATISWSAPATNNGATIDTYTVWDYSYNAQSGTWTYGSSVTCGAGCTSKTWPNLTNGVQYYFRVNAHNVNGYSSFAQTNTITIDNTPATPVITSPTHDPEGQPSANQSPQFTWTMPSGASDVIGYSYQLATSANAALDQTVDGTGTSTSFSNVDFGEYWFQVRAENGAQIWGPVATYHLYLHAFAGASAANSTDTSPAGDTVPASPLDGLPPLAAPPAGGLGSILDRGPLFSNDSFFGGQLLPHGDPAAGLTRAFGGLVPPGVAELNPAPAVSGGLAGLRGISTVVPALSVVQAAVYEADTIRFNPDGSQQSSRTDFFVSCVPTTYNSNTGLIGLPTDHDLRILLCPDPTSLTSGAPQRVTFQLDALKPGVRVQVTAILQAGTQRLRVSSTARTVDHPIDTSGPTPTASFPCHNTGVLPQVVGAPGTDTTNGVCVELVSTPDSSNPAKRTASVTTATSGSLDAVDVFQDEVNGTSIVPAVHVAIGNVPASPKHAYTLTATDATGSGPDGRQLQLLLDLADDAGTANPNELLTLEQFASGSLVTRLRLSQVPTHFHTALTADLAPEGTVDTASIIGATITGTQPVATQETLVVERYQGSALQALLTLSSLPSSYIYTLAVARDGTTETGFDLAADFPLGAPSDGRLQLMRYRSGNLDSLLDLNHFAGHTELRARVDGDPSQPRGASLTLDNAAAVTAQIVQILQYPDNASPRRVVLTSAGADPAAVSAPVAGQNVRWDHIARTTNIAFSVDRQTSGAGAGLPKLAQITSTSSADLPADNRLEVTEQNGADTFGLILKAITPNHSFLVEADGNLDDLRHARINRINNQADPSQDTELYLADAQGVIAQVRLSGPSADNTGLLGGSPRSLNGTATSLADDYDISVDLTNDSNGKPANAELRGTLSSASPAGDFRFEDLAHGYYLHLHDLLAHFDYRLNALYDSNTGDPNAATISGIDESAASPNGTLELGLGTQLKFVSSSLTQLFQYKISIEGTLDNPTRATITQDDHGANPNQLLQLAAFAADPNVPRFRFTLQNGNATPALTRAGSLADLTWHDAAPGYALTLGRTDTSGDEKLSLGGTNSLDSPNSRIDLQRTKSGLNQSAHIVGLAPTWSLAAGIHGSTGNPDQVELTVNDSVRHQGDAVQFLNYDATGALTQNVAFLGDTSARPDGTQPRLVEATYNRFPASLFLTYSRVKDPNYPRDASFDIHLQNQDSGGTAAVPDAAADLGVLMYGTDPNTPAEDLLVTNLPATISSLKYERPPVAPQGNDNCLGAITYHASDSRLDIERLRQHSVDGCYVGDVKLQATDLPRNGFTKAEIHLDGSGTLETAAANQGGLPEPIGSISLSLPAPKGVADFVGREQHIDGNQVCTEAIPFRTACENVWIDLTPHLENLLIIVDAPHGLSKAEIRTNIASNGTAKSEPNGGDEIDHILWGLAPILGIRNDGDAELNVALKGDVTTGVTSTLHQKVTCCTKPVKTATFEDTFNMTGALKIRFYGWEVRQGGCSDPNSQTGSVRKCNRNDEQLTTEFGQMTHFHVAHQWDNVPFEPQFIKGDMVHNAFTFRPHTTTYIVPNLYDSFMSTNHGQDAPEKWSSHDDVGFQTDWFFASLLREIGTDLYGFVS
jgi:hypothetical protein